ncbi:hypothetical protein MMS82_26620 [Escherichia coli]|nr:hypothetical protein [Escherichia coli]
MAGAEIAAFLQCKQ